MRVTEELEKLALHGTLWKFLTNEVTWKEIWHLLEYISKQDTLYLAIEILYACPYLADIF